MEKHSIADKYDDIRFLELGCPKCMIFGFIRQNEGERVFYNECFF